MRLGHRSGMRAVRSTQPRGPRHLSTRLGLAMVVTLAGVTGPPAGASAAVPVSATVTASSPGEPDRAVTATVGPVAAGTIEPTTTPTITGMPRVGALLTGRTGSWDPAAALSYRWFVSGVPVAGATSLTFTPGAAHVSQPITLRVKAVREGYRSVTVSSVATSPVTPGPFTFSSAPTITGTLRVGGVLTAAPGAWSPTPTFFYQWRADGVAISSATGRTYAVQPTDRTKRITVRVTARRTGYTTVSRTSAATAAVGDGVFTAAPVPRVAGTVQIRSTVIVTPGTWSPTSTLTYQWRVDGATIAGATGKTFLIPTAYLGKALWVTVTGRRPGYATVSRTSEAAPVTQPFTAAPTPTVSAQLVRVGWVISASSSVWSPGATLAVQWRRDGVAIPGATGWTHRMTTADLGRRMTATVTGRATRGRAGRVCRRRSCWPRRTG
ncbi:MAG: hypothetical protein JWP82_1348 [Humibacillus sp.]|nr:hypothetical protein [Humibacillus sp.]